MWWYDAKHIDHQVILLCKKYIEEQRSCKFAGQAFTCIYYHLLLLYVGGWHWLFNSLLNMDLIPKVGRRRAQSKGFSDRRRFAVIFWCWLVRENHGHRQCQDNQCQPSRFCSATSCPRSPDRGNINCSLGQNGCCFWLEITSLGPVLLWVAISISTNAESIGGSQNLRWFILKMHQKHIAGPNNSKIFHSRESFRTIWMTWHPTPPSQGFLTSDVQELHWRQCVDPGHRYRLLGQGYSKWDDPFMSSGRHQTTSSNFMKTYYLRTSMQLGSWLLYRTPPPYPAHFLPRWKIPRSQQGEASASIPIDPGVARDIAISSRNSLWYKQHGIP